MLALVCASVSHSVIYILANHALAVEKTVLPIPQLERFRENSYSIRRIDPALPPS